ncbi:MAG: hypothetical protein HQL32_06575 [Planctomycetes bacterium]|nr:hypothetical protein [Planctomycetota bacterium]
MGILNANLKHYYQRRGSWLFMILMIPMSGFMYAVSRDISRFFSVYCVMLFMMGIWASSLQKDIMVKPYSFCLPNHRPVLGKFTFLSSFIFAFLLSLFAFTYDGFTLSSHYMSYIGLLFLGMACFLLATNLVMALRQSGALFGFFGLFTLFPQRGHEVMNTVLYDYPLLPIALGMTSMIYSWFRFGQPALFRKWCGQMHLGVFDSYNKKKALELRKDLLLKNASDKRVKGGGLSKIFWDTFRRKVPLTLIQQIWGYLYLNALRFEIGLTKKVVIIQLVAVLFLGYVANLFVFLIIPMIFLAVLLMNMEMPLYSDQVLTLSRKNKFLSTLTVTILVTLLSVVFLLSCVLITHIVEPIMPDITLSSSAFTYKALDASLVLVVLFGVPVVSVLKMFFKQSVALVLVIFLFQMIALPYFIMRKPQIDESGLLQSIPETDQGVILLLSLMAWALYIWLLKFCSLKRCLMKPA